MDFFQGPVAPPSRPDSRITVVVDPGRGASRLPSLQH